jgi:hypothetical protein
MRMRVCYLDGHEAGQCCYLVLDIENLLHPLQLFLLPFVAYLLTLPRKNMIIEYTVYHLNNNYVSRLTSVIYKLCPRKCREKMVTLLEWDLSARGGWRTQAS